MTQPDFVRIRREIDKLQPSFPAALDRAFKLMKQHHLEKGGDKHHGLMKSIWPKYKDFKRSPWNLVRLPRQQHTEVHVLMAAAFVETTWFSKFNSAYVIAQLSTVSIFDSHLWQKRIKEFTKNGTKKLFTSRFAKQYGISPDGIHHYARKKGIAIANISEAKKGILMGSEYDSPKWQRRINEFTHRGVFYPAQCTNKYRAPANALNRYAKSRDIRTATVFEAAAARYTVARRERI